jgi:hypothetical protein
MAAGEREHEPQQAERGGDDDGDHHGGQAAGHKAGHQQDRDRDGQADRGQAGNGHRASRPHQPFLLALAEDQPVIGHGPDQQYRRQGRQDQADQVQVPLAGAELGELGRERQGEQEPEQDLHPQPGDAQFLQQLTEIAVIPLRLGLMARITGCRGLRLGPPGWPHPARLPGTSGPKRAAGSWLTSRVMMVRTGSRSAPGPRTAS